MRLKETLEHLINIPSPTGQEWRLIPFLVRRLEQCGFSIELQEVEPDENLTPQGRYWNIIGRRGESPLTFVVHYDTVPAREYRAYYRNGRIYGRGSVDVKGQIASLLHALENSNDPVNVVFVADEEVGGSGSACMPVDETQTYIVLEPTNLKPVVTHAGSVEAEITFKGNGGHGSLNHSNSAFALMMNFLNELENFFPFNVNNDLHRTTVYRVRAGSEMLAIPDRVDIGIDVRVFPEENAEEIKLRLQEKVNALGGEVKIREIAQPVNLDLDWRWEWFTEVWTRQGLSAEPFVYPSWTDAVNIIERGGWALVVGAGDLSVAHSDNESVSLEELEKFSEALTSLVSSQDLLVKKLEYVRQREYV